MGKQLENMLLSELRDECKRRKLPAKYCRKSKAELLAYLQQNQSAGRSSTQKNSKKTSPKKDNKRSSPKKYKNTYSSVELEGWDVSHLKEECSLKESPVYCKQLHRDELISLLKYDSVGQKFFNFLPTFDFPEEHLQKMEKKDLITLCRGAGVSTPKCNKMTKSQLIITRLRYQELH